MQLKTAVIYHLILTGMAIIKKIKCWSECEEIGAVCIASGNLKWCGCFGKHYDGYSKN